MSGRLPEWIDPLRLVEQRAELSGTLALAGMSRLGGFLCDQQGEIQVQLSFGHDAPGLRLVEGRLQADLRQICQRCLQPVTQHLDVPVRLGLVLSEQEADRLPENVEPLLVGRDPVRLTDIVEDELMLSLPVVALHEGEAACVAVTERYTQQPVEADEKRPNPFDVLSQLRDKKQ